MMMGRRRMMMMGDDERARNMRGTAPPFDRVYEALQKDVDRGGGAGGGHNGIGGGRPVFDGACD